MLMTYAAFHVFGPSGEFVKTIANDNYKRLLDAFDLAKKKGNGSTIYGDKVKLGTIVPWNLTALTQPKKHSVAKEAA